MATVEGIRLRLKDTFTEQQADVLAHVVVEAHAVLYFCYRARPESRTAVADAGAYLASPHRLLVRPTETA